jgi:hypothetical protein
MINRYIYDRKCNNNMKKVTLGTTKNTRKAMYVGIERKHNNGYINI